MTKIEGQVHGVEVTPTLVVAASREDRRWRAWSRADGALLHEVDTGTELFAIAVEGRVLAVGGFAGFLALFDVQSADRLQVLSGPTRHVVSIALRGDTVVSGSADDTVRVWSKASGECLRVLQGHNASVYSLAFDGEIIVSGSDDETARVWDPANGECIKVLQEHTNWVKCVALDEREIMTGSGDNSIKVWSRAQSFECVKTLTGHSGTVSSLAMNADTIVSGSWDNTVKIWSRASGSCLHTLQGHTREINRLSLDGDTIASGADDSTVRIWSLSSATLFKTLDGTEPRADPSAFDFGADAQLSSNAVLRALQAALENGDPREWGRLKMMFIGQGAAGKTSTVRSLLGLTPIATHESTVGAELKLTRAEDWQERDPTESDFEQLAVRAAVLRMDVGDQKNKKATKSLSRRLSGALVKRVSGRRSSQASEAPFEAKEKVPLLAEEEIAKRFDLDEVEQHLAVRTTQGTKISFAIWDYGGQEVFYALHHIFLTANGGLYVLVFNMQELVEDTAEAVRYLLFWLNSVKLHAPRAPIILVGTHLTKSTDLKAVERVLQSELKVREEFKTVPNSAAKLSFFPVDNMSTQPNRAADLREVIEKTAETKVPAVSQKVSLRWLKVLDDLLMLDTPHVPFDEVKTLATKYKSGDQTEEMLAFFHELGAVVHLRTTSALHNTVILQPQWLLDKLARVIADDIHVQDLLYDPRMDDLELTKPFGLLRRTGVASRALLEFLWEDADMVDFLLDFMRDTMLLSDWRFNDEPEFLVSSLTTVSGADAIDTSGLENGLTAVLDFSSFFLPDGVFQRLVSLCAEHSGKTADECRPPQLSRAQAVFGFGLSDFCLEVDGDQIWLRIHPEAEAPVVTIKTLVSMFQDAREAVFQALPWELRLRSPQDRATLANYDEVVKARKAGKAKVKAVNRLGNVDVAVFEPFFDEAVGFLNDDSSGDAALSPLAEVRPPSRGNKFHVFLSHRQKDTGDACGLLAEKLDRRGIKAWFDQRSEAELTADEMERGVRESQCYLLFLSKTVFESPFVALELQAAKTAGKKLLFVHEADPNRPGFAPFSAYISSAPSDCANLFSEAESLPFRRRFYEQESFLKELVRRLVS